MPQPPRPRRCQARAGASDRDRYKFANCTRSQPVFHGRAPGTRQGSFRQRPYLNGAGSLDTRRRSCVTMRDDEHVPVGGGRLHRPGAERGPPGCGAVRVHLVLCHRGPASPVGPGAGGGARPRGGAAPLERQRPGAGRGRSARGGAGPRAGGGRARGHPPERLARAYPRRGVGGRRAPVGRPSVARRGGAAGVGPGRPHRAGRRRRGRPERAPPARGAGRGMARDPPHREPRPPARAHGRGGGRGVQPVRAVLGHDEHRRHHSRRLLPDQRDLRPVPRRHLRAVERVGPPLLVVQQPVVPAVHRVYAGGGGHHPLEMVRRLSRPRGVLQRALRSADGGADRHPGGPGRARLHVVPLHRARRQHHGPGPLHHRVPAAARPRGERAPAAAQPARPPAAAGPRTPSRHVHETVPPGAERRVLLLVPQGAPGPAGQRLPVGAGVQRVRQLAGVGGLRTGRPVVLLPRDAADLQLVPHAPRAVRRPRRPRRLRAVAPLPRREHRGAVRQPGRRAARGGAGLPAGRAGDGRRVRHHPRGRRPGPGRGGRAGGRAHPVEHVSGRRGVAAVRGGAAPAGRTRPRRGHRAPRPRAGGGAARRIGAPGGGGPHPQRRPLLSRGHRRRLRRLGRARGGGRPGTRAAPQRRGGRRGQRAGGRRRALLPQPAARRARQPDQQAERVGDPIRRLCAAHPARRRRHRPLPAPDSGGRRRPHHPARQGQLPEVRVVVHPVGVRGRPRPLGIRRRRSPAPTTTAGGSSRATRAACRGR